MEIPRDTNNTSFDVQIAEAFKHMKDHPVLKRHQMYIQEWLRVHLGVMVQHVLGSGKTFIAASIIADHVAKDREVIFLSAKTLHDNMENTLQQYAKLTGTTIKEKYRFVTMNASNMIKQMNNVEERTLDDKLGIVSKMNLDNKVLIVDEAHNLFNSITNGSSNAVRLYRLVMKSATARVVFLTGTPIVNHPFELVPAFNMIARKEILPVQWDVFNELFVGENGIINKEKFQNRITGMVSYYGPLYFAENKTAHIAGDYPAESPIRIVKVPMSGQQYANYSIAREIERNELTGASSASGGLMKPKSLFSSSYKRLSRQLSNFSYPSHAMSVKGKKVVLSPDRVTNEDIVDKVASPKWTKMHENIHNNTNGSAGPGKHLVYSAFVNNAGIEMFARFLDMNSWVEYTLGDSLSKPARRYVKLTGNTDVDDRKSVIDQYNSAENIHGQQISLILISSAGAEGVDLKDVRFVHIMEPYWNWMRIEQVKGRAARYKSHIRLPSKLQNVATFVYISDYPKGVTDENEPHTTDLSLLLKSKKLHLINKTFFAATAEVAIDCRANNKGSKIKCRTCTPTGERLYMDDINIDMARANPCSDSKNEEIEAKEYVVDGKRYAVAEDSIYHWRDDLGMYIKLPRNDEMYSVIYNTYVANKSKRA